MNAVQDVLRSSLQKVEDGYYAVIAYRGDAQRLSNPATLPPDTSF